MISVTCTAPVNIAVVKYWGKRDEKLVLPINSSLSATLDQDQLRAKTSVAVSKDFTEDRMWLNGKQVSVDSARFQNVLQEIRRRAKNRKCSDDGDKYSNDLHNMLSWHIHICSENNFPTAAGLASSAAGLSCLVFSLARLFNIEGDISDIARQGSGSACRSMYGGFVAWDMGQMSDGSDSIARQIVKEDHWPEMSVLILVVSDQKKHVSSTAGMQTSVKTSMLLKARTTQVPARMDILTQAIRDKNFNAFAEETMKDSNQFHAVCLDTYPPISYMTDISRDIIRMVHAVNSHFGNNKAAYTFDAGPNACLYLLEENVPLFLGLVHHYFPSSDNSDQFIRGPPTETLIPAKELLENIPIPPSPGALKYVIRTKVGPGPRILKDEECLLNPDGLPKIIS